MLKIVKKSQLKPKQVQSHVKSEKEREEQIQKMLDSEQPLLLAQIHSHFEHDKSINAQHLARLISTISNTLSESNYLESIDLIITLFQKAHDNKQLKYFLKNKHKIADPILFLFIIFQRKTNPVSVSLASLVIDCCLLTLLLSGKEVITLWKKHIRHTAFCLKSREEILGLLTQQKSENKHNGFKSISIPL